MERETFICSCGNIEHQITFTRFEFEQDENDLCEKYDEISIDIHLNTHENLFKRLWVGLKYAMGYKSKYGHWDNILLEPNQIKELKEFLNKNY